MKSDFYIDKELQKRLTWKEKKWYNNQDDTISLQ